MLKLIPLALIAGLFLASCDCLGDICGCCGDDDTSTEQEAPSEN
jgi:hypothetical protein